MTDLVVKLGDVRHEGLAHSVRELRNTVRSSEWTLAELGGRDHEAYSERTKDNR